MDVLIRFQFDDREPPGTSDGKQIEDAMFTPGVCKNLGINELLIEDGVDARDVLTNKAFQPAFWLSTVKRVLRPSERREARESAATLRGIGSRNAKLSPWEPRR